MTDLSLCIKKRTSNINIKEKGGAETKANGDKIIVHIYITNLNRFLTWKAIGASKTNASKDSAWHIFRRILLFLVQNHIITVSGILQHHNLHAKHHGTVSGILALFLSIYQPCFCYKICYTPIWTMRSSPHIVLSCLFGSQDLTEREWPITHRVTV